MRGQFFPVQVAYKFKFNTCVRTGSKNYLYREKFTVQAMFSTLHRKNATVVLIFWKSMSLFLISTENNFLFLNSKNSQFIVSCLWSVNTFLFEYGVWASRRVRMASYFVRIWGNFGGMRFISQNLFDGLLIIKKLSQKIIWELNLYTDVQEKKYEVKLNFFFPTCYLLIHSPIASCQFLFFIFITIIFCLISIFYLFILVFDHCLHFYYILHHKSFISWQHLLLIILSV